MIRGDPNLVPEGVDEEAADWCMRLAAGRLSPTDEAAFETWLDVPGNRDVFGDATRVWHGVQMVAEQPEAIRFRSQALETYRHAGRRRWTRSDRGWGMAAARIAAALLVLVASGYLLLRDPAQQYVTGVGKRQIATLADGSTLTLDAATAVETRMVDDRRQLVLLRGRARFDVAPDPLRPFSVVAGTKTIVATGTSFSVELVDGQVRVILYEGHVQVLDRAAGDRSRRDPAGPAPRAPDVKMEPGSELVASGSGAAVKVEVKPADAERSSSWESGQLDFFEEPLGLAVERMNRYSAVRLSAGDAADLPVSGVFTAGKTDAFVDGVTAVLPVRAVRRNDGLTFERSNRR